MFVKRFFLLPLLLEALQSEAQFLTRRPGLIPGLQNSFATRFQNMMSATYINSHHDNTCQTDSGLSGHCVSSLQCRIRNGTPSGRCQRGFKVCCLETRTCNQDVVRNDTYFLSPNKVEEGLHCPVRVHKLPGVCQLRLDFEQLSLRGPDPLTGVCDIDRLVIEGKDTNSIMPRICGENDGQHVYVDISTVRGPINLLITTLEKLAGNSLNRKWNIKIAQIPCDSLMRAPQGCLQYFTGPGANQRIRSFNYGNLREKEMSYPSGANYAVCIRKEMGLCIAAFESRGKFGISGLEEENVETGPCNNKDYIMIGDTKYCGGKSLPSIVNNVDATPKTKGSGPLIMNVVMEIINRPLVANDVKYPGFDIRYKQETCTP